MSVSSGEVNTFELKELCVAAIAEIECSRDRRWREAVDNEIKAYSKLSWWGRFWRYQTWMRKDEADLIEHLKNNGPCYFGDSPSEGSTFCKCSNFNWQIIEMAEKYIKLCDFGCEKISISAEDFEPLYNWGINRIKEKASPYR